MSAVWSWPALQDAQTLAGLDLACHRGIWGKVHGEASDYRWIARSEGFADACPELAGALRIGAEDTQVTGPLWRCLGDRYLAVSVYPSRARDSAGRSAVVEKQVCEWRPPPGVPGAAGALMLLPEIVRFDDGDWWDRRGSGRWQDPDYALEIDAGDCPDPGLDIGELDARIGEGLASLRSRVAHTDLSAFYLGLLGARGPAALRARAPLTAAALSVLLLPLPRQWADRLSLAGTIATRRIDTNDLIRNWDGFAGGMAVARDARPGDTRLRTLAASMADALLGGDPRALARPLVSTNRSSFSVAPMASGPKPAESRAAPPPSVPLLSSPGAADPTRLHPILGDLTPAPADASPLIHLVHEFARDVEARRLDPVRLEAALVDGSALDGLEDEPQAHLLCLWSGEVEQLAPDWVDRADWRLKVDQLRALAALLVPSPERAISPGLPRRSPLPALIPLLAFTPDQAGPRLARLGEAACLWLVAQSLGCRDARLRAALTNWLEAWCGHGSAPPWAEDVRAVIQESAVSCMGISPGSPAAQEQGVARPPSDGMGTFA